MKKDEADQLVTAMVKRADETTMVAHRAVCELIQRIDKASDQTINQVVCAFKQVKQ